MVLSRVVVVLGVADEGEGAVVALFSRVVVHCANVPVDEIENCSPYRAGSIGTGFILFECRRCAARLIDQTGRLL